MRLPAVISLSMHAAFIVVFLVGGRYERTMTLGGFGPGDFTPVTMVGPEALRGRSRTTRVPEPKAPPAPRPELKPVESKPEPKPESKPPTPPKPKVVDDGVKISDQTKEAVKTKPDTTKAAAAAPARPMETPADAALAGVAEVPASGGGTVAAGIEVGLGDGGGGGGGGFGDFGYYRLAMQNKIAANWSPGFVSGEAACIIYFRIIRSGAVVGARVEESSGIPFYDQTALRAVVESSPFPPLPAQLPDDMVGVHFRFRYQP